MALGKGLSQRQRKKPLVLVGILLFVVSAPLVTQFGGFSSAYADVQTWSKTYGGPLTDIGTSVDQTSDGGYVVAGLTDSFGDGSTNLWVLKLDSAGDVEWENVYGSISSERVVSIEETPDGGFVVGAQKYNVDGFFDILVLKLDSDGNVDWEKAYGDSDSHQVFGSLGVTADGGFVVAGETYNPSGPGAALWILRLDSEGNVEWQNTYDATGGGSTARSIQQTSDGGYILTAITQGFGDPSDDSFDAWILKLDSDGNIEWANAYGGGSPPGVQDIALSLQQTSDGAYIVAGLSDSFSTSASQMWIFKLTSGGDVEWEKAYSFGAGRSIDRTSEGGYIVTGDTFLSGGQSAQWLVKLDSDGNIEWEKALTVGISTSLQQTLDGGYVLGGFSPAFSTGSTDFWVIKLDSEGNIAKCSRDFIKAIESSVNDIDIVIDEARPEVEETSNDVTDIDPIVENTNASIDDQCSAQTYSLHLFEDGRASDGRIAPGQEVRALAGTNDPTVDKVTFTWTSLKDGVIKEVTIPLSSQAEDLLTPEQAGEWIVAADFGNGQVVEKRLSIGFFVIPESPIGAVAIVVSSLAVLGLFTKLRGRIST